MNRYYRYENMELWREEAWREKISPLADLTAYTAERGLYRDEPLPRSAEERRAMEENAAFDKRLNAWLPDSLFREWEEKGCRLVLNHAGEHWMALIPDSVLEGRENNPKTLLILNEVDYRSDPYYALDAVEIYRDRLEAAAAAGNLLVFTTICRSDRTELAVIILRELTQRYRVRHGRLYLDIERFCAAGCRLEEVPGFIEKYCPGETPVIENFFDYGVRAINITGKWASRNSLQLANFYNGGIGTVPLDYDRLIYSHIGRRCAAAIHLEYAFDRVDEPGVRELFDTMGIEARYHETDGRGWVTVVPKSALDRPEEPLPCMCIMQEINPADRHTVLSAYAMWYEYLEIAAQGDLMLLFFVLEDVEDNELLIDLVQEAGEMYPFLDRTALYITGHSHNGGYAMEFYRRHPTFLAGCGVMGGNHGYGDGHAAPKLSGEELDEMAKVDMPFININGDWENSFIDLEKSRFLSEERRITLWQNRLRAFNCEPKSPEEILGISRSPSKADRKLGVPTDHSETLYFEGDECYIGDCVNREGKTHLRVVTLDNMPHGTTAHMPWLTFGFLRRFRRDPETGGIRECF